MTDPTETPLDECRIAFDKWCIKYHGYKLAPSMNEHHMSEWKCWQAAWNRTSPPAGNEEVGSIAERAVQRILSNNLFTCSNATGDPVRQLKEGIVNALSHHPAPTVDVEGLIARIRVASFCKPRELRMCLFGVVEEIIRQHFGRVS